MWKKFYSKQWSPWGSGIAICFLFLLTLYILNDPVGTDSAYVKLMQTGEKFLNDGTITWNWQLIFIIGIFIGGFISAICGNDFKVHLFPEDHTPKGAPFYLTFGAILTFVGGFLVMTGLIMAGNTFLKLWTDSLSLYIITGIFVVISFTEAVILGTIFSFKIEEKK